MRTLLLILLSSTIAVVAQPVLPSAFWTPAAAVLGPCNVAKDANTGATTGLAGMGGNVNGVYSSGKWTNSASSYTVCALDIIAWATNSPAGTAQAFIYADSGTNGPGAVIGTGSDTVDLTTFPATEGAVTFTNMSASISANTLYWIVIKVTNQNKQALKWTRTNKGTVDWRYSQSADGLTWVYVDSFLEVKFQLYSR